MPRSVVREERCVFRVESRFEVSADGVERREEVVSHWFISASSVSLYWRLEMADMIVRW